MQVKFFFITDVFLRNEPLVINLSLEAKSNRSAVLASKKNEQTWKKHKKFPAQLKIGLKNYRLLSFLPSLKCLESKSSREKGDFSCSVTYAWQDETSMVHKSGTLRDREKLFDPRVA